MKLTTVTFILSTTFATLVLSQGAEDPGPSPTASVGCEPHGDHWDCDGPRAAGVATTTSATAAAAEDEETATPTFPPPTESVGCVAHGDHYDCEGPATAAQATTPPTATGAVGTSNGTTADTEDPPVVPFEGGATNMRVMSAIGMTGLVGIIALFVL